VAQAMSLGPGYRIRRVDGKNVADNRTSESPGRDNRQRTRRSGRRPSGGMRGVGVVALSLAGHDDALAEMSRRADEFVAALASVEEKLAKRDDALSRAERELSDRSAAVEALQSEIISRV
jgi:hypothetical protein